MSTAAAGPARFDPFTDCPRCHGLGRMLGNGHRCRACGGTGIEQPATAGEGQ